MSEPVTITSMSVVNFQGIAHAAVTLSGGTVFISGDNGQGKSSFLNAVATLFFGADYAGKVPVRKGEKRAEIVGTLSNGLHCRMTITEAGTVSLAVTDASGLKLGTPRAVLNKLVGSLAFDPLRFITELDPKKQIAELKTICGLDFTALDKQRDELYRRRTDVNREAKSAQNAVDQSPAHDASAPASEVSVAELMTELKKIQQHNATCDRQEKDIAAGEEALAANTRAQLELLAKLDELKEQEAKYRQALAARKAASSAKRETVILENQIAESGTLNQKLASNKRRAELEAVAKRWADESEKLTQQIDAIDADKSAKLAAAKMPIEGLGFTDDYVTYKGLPLQQASTREQMEISFAICASLNPTLRAVIIPHGSLITPSNRPHFEEIAKRYGMQPLVELADESGEVPGIVISEGRVVRADNQSEIPAAPGVKIALDQPKPSAVVADGPFATV